MTKIQQAQTIFAANPTATRKDLIAMFVEKLGMTDAGASTYVYTCQKKAKESPVVVAAELAKEAEVELEQIIETAEVEVKETVKAKPIRKASTEVASITANADVDWSKDISELVETAEEWMPAFLRN